MPPSFWAPPMATGNAWAAIPKDSNCKAAALRCAYRSRNGDDGADKLGFKDLAGVHWNLDAPMLYEHAIAGRECALVQGGAICAETGVHTGRSPKDKHTVVDALTEHSMWWEGNRKITPAQ